MQNHHGGLAMKTQRVQKIRSSRITLPRHKKMYYGFYAFAVFGILILSWML